MWKSVRKPGLGDLQPEDSGHFEVPSMCYKCQTDKFDHTYSATARPPGQACTDVCASRTPNLASTAQPDPQGIWTVPLPSNDAVDGDVKWSTEGTSSPHQHCAVIRGAAVGLAQGGLSRDCRGSPRQHRPLQPANKFDTTEAAATLSLRMLSSQPICFTRKRIARLSQSHVNNMLDIYGVKMRACLLAAETSPGSADREQLQGLVNEVISLLSVLDIVVPFRLGRWKLGTSRSWLARSAESWDDLLDVLDLTLSQVERLAELREDHRSTLTRLCCQRRDALNQASQELSPGISSADSLLDVARVHSKLVARLKRQITTYCKEMRCLREEVLLRVLTPMQAARVFVAATPGEPDVWRLLEAVDRQYGAVLNYRQDNVVLDDCLDPWPLPCCTASKSSFPIGEIQFP